MLRARAPRVSWSSRRRARPLRAAHVPLRQPRHRALRRTTRRRPPAVLAARPHRRHRRTARRAGRPGRARGRALDGRRGRHGRRPLRPSGARRDAHARRHHTSPTRRLSLSGTAWSSTSAGPAVAADPWRTVAAAADVARTVCLDAAPDQPLRHAASTAPARAAPPTSRCPRSSCTATSSRDPPPARAGARRPRHPARRLAGALAHRTTSAPAPRHIGLVVDALGRRHGSGRSHRTRARSTIVAPSARRSGSRRRRLRGRPPPRRAVVGRRDREFVLYTAERLPPRPIVDPAGPPRPACTTRWRRGDRRRHPGLPRRIDVDRGADLPPSAYAPARPAPGCAASSCHLGPGGRFRMAQVGTAADLSDG